MEVKSKCPHCLRSPAGPDPGEHLYTNVPTGLYFCFRCGAKGRAGGISPLRGAKQYRDARDVELYSFVTLRLPGSREVYHYLRGRLPERVILAAARWSPALPKRAVFPIYHRGKVVFWTARSIDGSEPRHYSSGSKSHFVYNVDNAHGRWGVICEGVFDALSTPNGVAIFGKVLSNHQFRLIVNRFDTAFIALDGDADRKAVIGKLRPFVRVKEVRLEKDEDPSSVGFDEMQRRVREAGI